MGFPRFHEQQSLSGFLNPSQPRLLTGPDTKGGTHNGVVAHPIEVWEESRAAAYIHTRAKLLHLALTEGRLPPKIEPEKRWMCGGYCSMIEQCEEAR